MKRLFLLAALLLAFCEAYAQIPLTGKVYELNTHVTLPQIKVQNTNTRDNTLTNETGVFNIKAKPGDILILTGFAYQPDTVVVVNARYLEIYLKPQTNHLKEVKVQDIATKTGSLKDPNLQNQTVVYQKDETGNYKGGIAIRFGYGKSSKEKKDEQRAYNEEVTKEIDQAFAPDNISKYVPLKGIDLKQFIDLYRPTIKEFKATNFDLTLYLNECYKKFVLLPPDQRKLPSLKAGTTKN